MPYDPEARGYAEREYMRHLRQFQLDDLYAAKSSEYEEIDELKKRISDLNTEISQKIGEIKTLRGPKMAAQRVSLQDEIDQLKAEKQDVKDEIDSHYRTIKEINEEIQDLKSS